MTNGTRISSEAGRPETLPKPDASGTEQAMWRVLVAEDIPSQQKLLVTMLTKYGHMVHTADDGEEAVDVFRQQPLDIILMDVQMPGMSGLDAIRAIRSREIESGSHVPIVAVTAHALTGDSDKCLAAGADSYLRKPINLVDLLSLLKRLIDQTVS